MFARQEETTSVVVETKSRVDVPGGSVESRIANGLMIQHTQNW